MTKKKTLNNSVENLSILSDIFLYKFRFLFAVGDLNKEQHLTFALMIDLIFLREKIGNIFNVDF